jgi:hypothetical protein
VNTLINKGTSKPRRSANPLPRGCVSTGVVARCPGWQGHRDDRSGQWLGSRTDAEPPGDRPSVVTAPDEETLVEAVEREMFVDLAAWYGAAWELGRMASGRFRAARRSGVADAPSLLLYAETVAGLAALLAESARQAAGGRTTAGILAARGGDEIAAFVFMAACQPRAGSG